MPVITKTSRKALRKNRVRAKVSGTATRPRISVFRGLKTCFAQLIDDQAQKTLVSAAEHELTAAERKSQKTSRAKALGLLLAKKAKEQGINSAVLDRGGNKYHGRVAALADGAREGGLEF
ncbi:50S ribosomal protein L18 [Candidatus Uhrbacteria bacterium]|nr:50S ribosomal protein L18 [Candidatus Uhrbacteria bacterium]